MEIIVIDSASPQNEGAVVKELQNNLPNLVYLRTDSREGLYKAWNRAVKISRGKYLTNANTDDRHHPQSFEKMVSALEFNPSCALAYHYQIVSDKENETFEDCLARNPHIRKYPPFSAGNMLKGCIIGSQPMWRRNVHEEHGLFSERYKIGGDYEFWMRIAQTHPFICIQEPLGLVYESDDTLSGLGNRFAVDSEVLDIHLQYFNRAPWNNTESRKILSDYHFAVGYRYIELLNNLPHAGVFLKHAWRFNPTNLYYAKTYLLRGLLRSHWRLPPVSTAPAPRS